MGKISLIAKTCENLYRVSVCFLCIFFHDKIIEQIIPYLAKPKINSYMCKVRTKSHLEWWERATMLYMNLKVLLKLDRKIKGAILMT